MFVLWRTTLSSTMQNVPVWENMIVKIPYILWYVAIYNSLEI